MAAVKPVCRVISTPRSQVTERRSCEGICWTAIVSAAITLSVPAPIGRCSNSRYRVVRPTRVATWDRPRLPTIRSPSQ